MDKDEHWERLIEWEATASETEIGLAATERILAALGRTISRFDPDMRTVLLAELSVARGPETLPYSKVSDRVSAFMACLPRPD
ncbi:hypothetical protein [Microbaculum marinisediminis]|uniref:DUF222 domain-containing protein n=1 Tax=Microbaculum marinisediminis TaxID=2931392 RepID=A0AAW5QVV5_9HYPH|nr:hypothetical protein [Microbaculum sp. A6E488]MCT8970621.1 hypothetical protein [Microbaculum sp. A6E488]